MRREKESEKILIESCSWNTRSDSLLDSRYFVRNSYFSISWWCQCIKTQWWALYTFTSPYSCCLIDLPKTTTWKQSCLSDFAWYFSMEFTCLTTLRTTLRLSILLIMRLLTSTGSNMSPHQPLLLIGRNTSSSSWMMRTSNLWNMKWSSSSLEVSICFSSHLIYSIQQINSSMML